jgi:ABC-type branched-subunit amino acid transport system ATPase component
MTRTDPAAALLSVDGVSVSFGGVRALDGASLEVPPGTVTAVIGPNGAGKTTLFDCISGLTRPDSGEISFRGVRLGRTPPHRRAIMGIGRAFQETRVFERMSVLDIVLVGAHDVRGESPLAALRRSRRDQEAERVRQARAAELLEWVGVPRPWDKLAQELSYGQQKLVALCRLLMSDPELLLLDEPVAGVRQGIVEEIGGRMREIAARGTTVLVIEHNMTFVWRYTDYVHVLAQGRVLVSGEPAEVRANSSVLEAYLGDVREELVHTG